jgi:lipoprotein-anchoring transpeptidase ErfK/SrfK
LHDVVNPLPASVYQTDAGLIFSRAVQTVSAAMNAAPCPVPRAMSRGPRVNDETVQSTSMFRKSLLLTLAGISGIVLGLSPALARDALTSRQPRAVYTYHSSQAAYAERSDLGGGFIEFLFSGDEPPRQRYQVQQSGGRQSGYAGYPGQADPGASWQRGGMNAPRVVEPSARAIDPKYERQLVAYHGKEKAGTIVIDTPNKFLYLVQGDGTALRYGVGVGRPGFAWSGVKTITAKREWPDWTPPAEMLKRRPDLPRHMEGGPENPLGARALYLGSSLYRIHGSNEPWTIGTNVSSGCIRMRNQDVIDLYGRVGVGARVVVI